VAADPGGRGAVEERVRRLAELGVGGVEDRLDRRAGVEGGLEELRALGDEGALGAARARPLCEAAEALDALVAEAEGRLAQEAASVSVSCASRCWRATATICAKAAWSRTARSARILRSTVTSAAFRPAMRRE